LAATSKTGIVDAIDAVERQGGTAGVSLITPTGERFSHNGTRAFHSASTVKIPVMVEIFRQIERDELDHSDVLVLTDEDRTPGSGVLTHLHEGLQITLDDLLYLMISISDNSATNMLVDLAGLEAINATMADLGMTASSMNRLMLGRTPREDEPENWATPDDYATAMLAIVADTAAAPESCALMRDLLAKQQNTSRISRHLPEGIRWGSKTGSLPGIVNDVGFITTDAGTLVIACYLEGVEEETGEAAIAAIAKAAYDACFG
jgi:beta-lactamase class A